MLALEEVLNVVKERGAVYGPPSEDFARTAKLWSAFLGFEVTPAQVTACMMLLKISRLAKTPDHRDSFVDVAGYVHCYEDCINHKDVVSADEDTWYYNPNSSQLEELDRKRRELDEAEAVADEIPF